MKVTVGNTVFTASWNFTRIGKIDRVTREEFLDAFGEGKVTVTFSLE